MSQTQKDDNLEYSVPKKQRVANQYIEICFLHKESDRVNSYSICKILPENDEETGFGSKTFMYVMKVIEEICLNTIYTTREMFQQHWNEILEKSKAREDPTMEMKKFIEEMFRLQYEDSTNVLQYKCHVFKKNMYITDRSNLLVEWKISSLKSKQYIFSMFDLYEIKPENIVCAIQSGKLKLNIVCFTQFRYLGQISKYQLSTMKQTKKDDPNKEYISSKDWNDWPLYLYLEIKSIIKDIPKEDFKDGSKSPDEGYRFPGKIIGKNNTHPMYILNDKYSPQFSFLGLVKGEEDRRIMDNIDRYIPSLCNSMCLDQNGTIYLKVQSQNENYMQKSNNNDCTFKMNPDSILGYDSLTCTFKNKPMVGMDDMVFKQDYIDDNLFNNFYTKFGFIGKNNSIHVQNEIDCFKNSMIEKVNSGQIGIDEASKETIDGFKKIYEKLNCFVLLDFFKSCSIYDNKTIEKNTVSDSNKIDDFESRINYIQKATRNHVYSNRLDATCIKNSNVLAKVCLCSILIKENDDCSPKFKLLSLAYVNNTPNI